jgi:hypothetical protein
MLDDMPAFLVHDVLPNDVLLDALLDVLPGVGGFASTDSFVAPVHGVLRRPGTRRIDGIRLD